MKNTTQPLENGLPSEGVRYLHVCAWCARENGSPPVPPGWKVTHGICKRHQQLFFETRPEAVRIAES